MTNAGANQRQLMQSQAALAEAGATRQAAALRAIAEQQKAQGENARRNYDMILAQARARNTVDGKVDEVAAHREAADIARSFPGAITASPEQAILAQSDAYQQIGAKGKINAYSGDFMSADFPVPGQAEVRDPTLGDVADRLFGRRAGASPLDYIQSKLDPLPLVPDEKLVTLPDGRSVSINDLTLDEQKALGLRPRSK